MSTSESSLNTTHTHNKDEFSEEKRKDCFPKCGLPGPKIQRGRKQGMEWSKQRQQLWAQGLGSVDATRLKCSRWGKNTVENAALPCPVQELEEFQKGAWKMKDSSIQSRVAGREQHTIVFSEALGREVSLGRERCTSEEEEEKTDTTWGQHSKKGGSLSTFPSKLAKIKTRNDEHK